MATSPTPLSCTRPPRDPNLQSFRRTSSAMSAKRWVTVGPLRLARRRDHPGLARVSGRGPARRAPAASDQRRDCRDAHPAARRLRRVGRTDPVRPGARGRSAARARGRLPRIHGRGPKLEDVFECARGVPGHPGSVLRWSSHQRPPSRMDSHRACAAGASGRRSARVPRLLGRLSGQGDDKRVAALPHRAEQQAASRRHDVRRAPRPHRADWALLRSQIRAQCIAA